MAAPIKITNKEFVQALAGDDWERVPISWGEDSWYVRPAGKNIDKPAIETSNYMTCSIFRPAEDGRFARKKELFERQFVFPVDDVATKINEGALRLTMPPATYELETSPGNFQFGYKLIGAADARKLAAVVDAIVGNKTINPPGTDPGMKGVTRVARLPVGSNNKEKVRKANGGKGWPHRLWVWEPSRAYTIEELADWLDVDLSEAALARYRDAGSTRRATAEEMTADPILRLFDMKGMLVDPEPNDNGFVTVLCPWRDEHSAGAENAGYLPGLGGYKCHHGHCESRGMTELKAWFAENVTPEEQTRALIETFGPVPPEDDPLLVAEVARAEARHKAKIEKNRATVEEVLADWAFVVDLHRFGSVKENALYPEKTFNALNPDLAPYGASGQKSAAAAFINDLHGPHCKTAAYEPGKTPIFIGAEDGRAVFNTWRPGAVRRWSIDDVTDADVAPWLDHVSYILPDETARLMFFRWCAFIVQRPGEKINWAYLLIGNQGVGKDMLLRPLYGIIGEKNYVSISTDDIEGSWTDWAEHQVIVVEELPSFHKRDVYDWLKRYVALGTPGFRVNKKNTPQYVVRNLQNWFIFSNHEDALALEADDRRYFVYASPVEKRGPDYYTPLVDLFESPSFQSRLFDWLLRFDISDFNPGEAPPMTTAKARMMESTRHPADQWLDDQFDGGKFEGRRLLQVHAILSDALTAGKYGGAPPDVVRGLNQTRVGRWLRKKGWLQMDRRRLPTLGRARLWVAPMESFTLLTQLSAEALEARYVRDAGSVAAGGGGKKNSSDEPF